MVKCCGEMFPAEVAVLSQAMTQRRVPLERQRQLWLDFYRQYPDATWAEKCLDEAERISRILERERRIAAKIPTSGNSATSPDTPPTAPSPFAQRHFMWTGDRLGVRAEHLRDGIRRLATGGLIDSSMEQQDALRRGFGLMLNDTERSTPQPWVKWLGDSSQLNYMVDTLWHMQLIHCAGGERQKWRTLCALFLDADGHPYPAAIKSNRCRSKEKREMIRRFILDELAFVSRQTLPS